jgi:hypothetical protein
VEAVVREKGRVGLDLVLGYEQASHWWEEGHVVATVRDMLLQNGAPGGDRLRGIEDLEQLRAWFEANGSEYAQRFKR